VQLHLKDEALHLDEKFSPTVIAHLDRIAADLDAGGKTFTASEVDKQLAANKAAWLANRPH